MTTVRIDKRGLAGSAGATPDGNAVTINDYVSDVQAWTSVIRKQMGASCIWLLGHSEGGLVAMAAAKSQSDICGLVLVSTAGRPMGEVLREQLKTNSANAPLLDPAQLLKDYPKPVLILQGLRDMQVHEADANILKEADSRAVLKLLPDVNHVLKSVSSDDRRANIATYSDASLPLAPGVFSDISDFLTANAKATRSGNLTVR